MVLRNLLLTLHCAGICAVLQLAVRQLDLAIAAGECFGLLGPNGAGKSTSISMLVGLQEPSAGTAIIGTLGEPGSWYRRAWGLDSRIHRRGASMM